MYKQPETIAMANSEIYDPENLPSAVSELTGKTFVALGSSITFGFGSQEVSFPEMIAKIDQCSFIKQAISGTTLACDLTRPETRPQESYVRQLEKISPKEPVDCFVVQLSTNDAQRGIGYGNISDSFAATDQDPSTITGAIEFILATIQETWNCPVIFYINAYLNKEYIAYYLDKHPDFPADMPEDVRKKIRNVDNMSKQLIGTYQDMIHILYDLQKKWNFEVVDLWNNETIQTASFETRELMMSDTIHPSKAGYLFWYVPEIRKTLIKVTR